MKAPLHLPFLLLLIPHSIANTPGTQDSTGNDAYQPANINITSWTGANCAGNEISNNNIDYDYNIEAETRSYKLSRPLAADEQLDWSTPPAGFVYRRQGIDQLCGLYNHTAPAGQGTDCVTFDYTLSCFRLWHY